MLKQRFVFAVSLFAILAVGNVWADTASGDAVKTAHDVYEDLSTTEIGIAGVSYVNKMVNAAGAAAQDAENHAASAGASALSAAAAASAAQTAADNAQTTADKVANKFDNTSTVKNAIVTTDANGKVAPVAISDTGTGTYVTGVTVSGGVVTLSRGTPTDYSLPTASASTKGGVKIGANVNVATDGTISVPTANGTSLGLVKQGTNITIGTDGTISAKDTTYSTGTATASGLTKLYTTTGTATDGTMTQAALNTALSGKQDTISDLAAIRSGAAAGATAVQPSEITDMQTKTSMIRSPREDAAIDNTLYPSVAYMVDTINDTQSQIAGDIADINATLADKQDTISDLATIRSGAAAGATAVQPSAISDMQTKTSMKKSSRSDAGTDNTVYPSVAYMMDTINNTQSEIAGDIADINATLAGKQDTISDLATIRSGAAAGATAVQAVATGAANGTISVDGDDVAVKGLGSAAYTESGAYATSAQGAKADTAVQPSEITDMQTKGNMIRSPREDAALYNTLYPSVAYMEDTMADKQATLTGTNVTSTGNGNVVTSVTAANGVVTVTKGTTLGSLATKSTVTSADITNSTIAAADLASSAVTTVKIADKNVTTAKIADGAVTVAKTTGLYGVIPSGSQGNTAATAFIWVE